MIGWGKTLLFATAFCPEFFLSALPAEVATESSATDGPAAFSLSLEEVPSRVAARNIQLRAMEFRIRESRARRDNAGRWSNPIATSFFQSEGGGSGYQAQFGFDQPIPLAGRLRQEKAVSERQLAVTEREVADYRRLLIAKARIVATKIVALQEEITIRDRQLKVAQELTEFVKQAGNQGEISPLDVDHAQMEEVQLELEIHHLKHDALAHRGELKAFLSLDPEVPLELSGSLPMPETTVSSGEEWHSRPDYQAALARIKTAESEVRLARARRWRDIQLGVLLTPSKEEDFPSGYRQEFWSGLRLTVPLPLWNDNRWVVEEKLAQVAQFELSAQALANEIRNQAAAERETMMILGIHAHEIRDELLPQIIEHMEHADVAFRAGQVDLPRLLRTRNRRVEIEVRLLESISNYHLAKVRYETTLGTQLEDAP